MLYYKFNAPEYILEDNVLVHPRDRMLWTPRASCPPELVTPHFESFGSIGPDRAEKLYMFTAELGDGVELNRFEGGYILDQKLDDETTPEQSLAIGGEIIRVYSHLTASTYNPVGNTAVVPVKMMPNNGDVIIKPDDLLNPKIRVIAINNVFIGSPATFVDRMLNPQCYEPLVNKKRGWFIPASVETLPVIFDSVANGVEAVFPGHGREVARQWFKEYADTQQREFDGFVRECKEVVGSTAETNEALLTALTPFIHRAYSSRLMQNDFFKFDFFGELFHGVRQGQVSTVGDVEEIAGASRPRVCPSNLISAIREM